MHEKPSEGLRHARRPVRTVVLVSRGDDAWNSEILDISASGALIARPEDWRGDLDDVFVLDVVISDSAALHLQARVARLTESHVAFAFTAIPDDAQHLFWGLLGRYAVIADDPDGP